LPQTNNLPSSETAAAARFEVESFGAANEIDLNFRVDISSTTGATVVVVVGATVVVVIMATVVEVVEVVVGGTVVVVVPTGTDDVDESGIVVDVVVVMATVVEVVEVVVVLGIVVVVVVVGVIAAFELGINLLGVTTAPTAPVMKVDVPHAYRNPSAPIDKVVPPYVSTIGNAAAAIGVPEPTAAAIPKLNR
jgi:hypothetical protein